MTERLANDRVIKNKRALNVTPYVIFGLILVNVLIAIGFVIRSNARIEMPPVYAADGKTGSVTKLVALPYNSQEGLAMVNFATQAITYCLNIDFSSFKDVSQQCKQEFFSTAGFIAFENALARAGLLEGVKSGNALIKAVLDGMPTLAEPGKMGASQLVYTVEVPLLVEQKRLGRDTKPIRQVGIVMIARDNNPETFDKFRIVQAYIEPRA